MASGEKSSHLETSASARMLPSIRVDPNEESLLSRERPIDRREVEMNSSVRSRVYLPFSLGE